mmetsp:Transcript_44586/g.88108  ORF Transcript_44586/g.88108 Transcript_44586/m.88108 type:complete len:390 (+) Transcript_44586:1066-2235(+)
MDEKRDRKMRVANTDSSLWEEERKVARREGRAMQRSRSIHGQRHALCTPALPPSRSTNPPSFLFTVCLSFFCSSLSPSRAISSVLLPTHPNEFHPFPSPLFLSSHLTSCTNLIKHRHGDLGLLSPLPLHTQAGRHEVKDTAPFLSVCLTVDELLDLVVHNQHQRPPGSTKDVGPGALEECPRSLLGEDFAPAVDCGSVLEGLSLGLSSHHHHASTDGVEGIRDDTGSSSHSLSDTPLEEEVCLLLISKEHSLGGIVQTEVGSSVNNNSLHGDAESLVERPHTACPCHLGEAVIQSGELSLGSALHIRRQAGTGKVEGIHNAQRCGPGKTSRGHVGSEETPELSLRVVLGEKVLEEVLESEVEGLSREVSDDVGHVSSPQRGHTLLLHKP